MWVCSICKYMSNAGAPQCVPRPVNHSLRILPQIYQCFPAAERPRPADVVATHTTRPSHVCMSGRLFLVLTPLLIKEMMHF